LYESKIPDIEAGLASADRRIDAARADGDLAGCRSPSAKRDGMSTQEILIVGGYGVVGRRIANELAADYPDRVVVAGRNPARAVEIARAIGRWCTPQTSRAGSVLRAFARAWASGNGLLAMLAAQRR
jgi:hypothetical protein